MAKSLTNKDPNSILNICNDLINKGKEPIAILQGLASILRDLVVTKVTNDPTNLYNISQENNASLKELANSIHLDQILRLQSRLKGSENYIRNSNQPKLWLEIHLLGMLSYESSNENNINKQSFITTKLSNDSDLKNINHPLETTNSSLKKEVIKETTLLEESETGQNINLDDIWKKVIAMLELPSTKMLLSQQAKLINLCSDSAEIAISGKWINMIQSRKNLIEDAFHKAIGSSTKVILKQQKDSLENQKKDEKLPNKLEQNNDLKMYSEANKNTLEKREEIQSSNSLDTKSIDQKAKQFADFFSGEIVNLE